MKTQIREIVTAMGNQDTTDLSFCPHCGRSYVDDVAVQQLKVFMGKLIREPQALVCPRCGSITHVGLDGKISIPTPEFIVKAYNTPDFVRSYIRMLSGIRARIGMN